MWPKSSLALIVLLAGGLLPAAPSGAMLGPMAAAVDLAEDLHCDQSSLHCHKAALATCDMRSKACPSVAPPRLPGYAMNGETIEPLRPLLDDDTYATLYGLLGGDKEGEPGPSQDQPFESNVSYGLGFHGAALFLGLGFNASLAGISASGASESNASISLGGSTPPPAEEGQVPCSDPRGCPDLTVDRSALLDGGIFTKDFDADDCAVLENSTVAGDRRLLRFTFTSPNLGRGDLIIGNPDDNLDWFQWGTCHGHWHFREYADYRLWTVPAYLDWRQARSEDPEARPDEVLDQHPELAEGFVAGHKQGFCAIDIRNMVPFTLDPKYVDCDNNQGISVGWADVYDFRLDGQWIDITGVAPGLYVLEAEVNPERLFQEEDYSRNSGAVFVLIPPER